jgi:hypothetical protein
MVQPIVAAARARQRNNKGQHRNIATTTPQEYLSILATLNGAKAAHILDEICSGAITPGITRPPARLLIRAALFAGRVHAVVMVQRMEAAARARPASHPSRCKEIAAPEPQGYLSTPAALNGAEAALKSDGICSGAITPGITRAPTQGA